MAAAIASAVLALGACGSARLSAPSYVQQPTAALQPASYPPPPARVEFIPATPSGSAVWLDGEWTWQGRRWAWKAGRWVEAPPNASYSPWSTVRDKTGTLYFAEGKWRDAKGQELPDPKPLALARVRGGAVVNPEGEQVPQAPDVRPDRAPAGPEADAGIGIPQTPSGATPTGTEPKGGALQNGGTQIPEGGAPLDAGPPDVVIKDAAGDMHAMPLGTSTASPRMVTP